MWLCWAMRTLQYKLSGDDCSGKEPRRVESAGDSWFYHQALLGLSVGVNGNGKFVKLTIG